MGIRPSARAHFFFTLALALAVHAAPADDYDPDSREFGWNADCIKGKLSSCHELASTHAHFKEYDAARPIFERACQRGYAKSCEALKALPASAPAPTPAPVAAAAPAPSPEPHEAKAPTEDPFRNVRITKLENGLRVVLHPSQGTEKIQVSVMVMAGMNEERSSNLGVAHLTEHSVFRDPKLGDKSYLDVLQQEGADTNGFTMSDVTYYFATMPAAKAPWLVDLYAKMLSPRTFDPEMVRKAKAEIALETDSPERSLGSLGSSDVTQVVESEFGVRTRHPTVLAGILQKRLKANHVQEFFEQYYHPANMIVTVVGRFDETEMLALVRDKFGKFTSTGKSARVEPLPVPRQSPFLHSTVWPFAPRVYVGTKFWSIEPQDELVLRSYLDMLGKRLMRALRTKDAQTYTANDYFWIDTRRFGFGIVTFETTAEAFSRNLAYVDDILQKETREGIISDKQLQLLRDAFLLRYQAIDTDLKSLADTATTLLRFQETYDTKLTPYETFLKISNAEYRDRLAKLFVPQRAYRVLYWPPLVSKWDALNLLAFALSLSLVLCRRALHRPANESLSTKYVVEVANGPLTRLVKWGGYACLFAMTIMLFVALNGLEKFWPGIHAHYVAWNYVFSTASWLIVFLAHFSYFALFPKRILVGDGKLVVRHGCYFSRSYAFSQVEEIAVVSTWKRLPRRVRRAHYGIYRPGVLIRFSDGTGYLVGLSNPEKAAVMLKASLIPVSPAPAPSAAETAAPVAAPEAAPPAPAEVAPAEVTPVEAAPAEVTLVEATPVEAAPAEVAPVEAAAAAPALGEALPTTSADATPAEAASTTPPEEPPKAA